jgi:hypothetical protein
MDRESLIGIGSNFAVSLAGAECHSGIVSLPMNQHPEESGIQFVPDLIDRPRTTDVDLSPPTSVE